MSQNKSFYYSRAHDAWLSVIAIKTGKQHQISLELEKQDFWQVPAAAASATSAARLRLVLTSCRQGRFNWPWSINFTEKMVNKIAISPEKTVTMSKRLVKRTYDMIILTFINYLSQEIIFGHFFNMWKKVELCISIFSPSSLSLDDLTYFV